MRFSRSDDDYNLVGDPDDTQANLNNGVAPREFAPTDSTRCDGDIGQSNCLDDCFIDN
jgi:hypothetical protein